MCYSGVVWVLLFLRKRYFLAKNASRQIMVGSLLVRQCIGFSFSNESLLEGLYLYNMFIHIMYLTCKRSSRSSRNKSSWSCVRVCNAIPNSSHVLKGGDYKNETGPSLAKRGRCKKPCESTLYIMRTVWNIRYICIILQTMKETNEYMFPQKVLQERKLYWPFRKPTNHVFPSLERAISCSSFYVLFQLL